MTDEQINTPDDGRVTVTFHPRLLVLFQLIHAARESVGVDRASMPKEDVRAKYLLDAYQRLTEAMICIASANVSRTATPEEISNLLGVMQNSLNHERVQLNSMQADEQVRLQQAALAAVGNTVH